MAPGRCFHSILNIEEALEYALVVRCFLDANEVLAIHFNLVFVCIFFLCTVEFTF